jgi:hypothetical protein
VSYDGLAKIEPPVAPKSYDRPYFSIDSQPSSPIVAQNSKMERFYLKFTPSPLSFRETQEVLFSSEEEDGLLFSSSSSEEDGLLLSSSSSEKGEHKFSYSSEEEDELEFCLRRRKSRKT